jgi:MFS family permease
MEKTMIKQSLKSEFKLLKKFYIFYFLWGLASFITAYWVVYFQDIGFSFKEISLILTSMFLAPIIFEVPTGAIADHFGRRISIFIGLFISGSIFILIPFTNKFYIIMPLFFGIMSISTLVSGADSAWMVDFLKSKNQSKLTRVVFSRTWSIVALSAGISYVLSSAIVAKLGMSYLWKAQGILLITTSLFVILFGDKEQIIRKGKFRGAMRSTFGLAKEGFKLILARRTLFFFMLAVFFNSFFMSGELAWQPFLINLGLPLPSLGLLYAGAVFLGIIAPMLSVKVSKILTDKWTLILEEIISGALLIIVAMITSPIIAIMIFYVLRFGTQFRSPLKSHFLHKHIPSKIRATTASINALFQSVGAATAMLLAGYIIDKWGLNAAFVFAGLAAIPTALCYLMMKDGK